MTRFFKIGFGLSIASILVGFLVALLIDPPWRGHIAVLGCIVGACIFIGTVALEAFKEGE